MKSIILAAGLGKRLWPLTKDCPKCLIDFNGSTFLGKQIEILESLGIKDIAIVVGHLAEKIKQATGYRLKYIYNSRFEQNGTLDSLALAKEEFDDDVILISSDALFVRGVLEKLVVSSNDICLIIDTSVRKKSATNVRVEGERIVDMGFLEAKYVSGVYCGISKFSKRVGDDIRNLLSKVKEDKKSYVFHLIKQLIKKGKTVGYIECDKNAWCEIDTHRDLKKNEKIINELLR